jgi:ATP-binding cassette subfamily C (CFTR/MRP) protein 1
MACSQAELLGCRCSTFDGLEWRVYDYALLYIPGMGLAMSNALAISGFLSGIVKQTVQLERRGVALERAMQYCDLPSEAPEVIEERRPAAHWPSEGKVVVSHLSVRYHGNVDLVLQGINLDIKSTEKIGVVGRTGAGKSTLSLALSRIVEAAEGHTTIAGVDTSTIGFLT